MTIEEAAAKLRNSHVWGIAKTAGHPAFTAVIRTRYMSGSAPAASSPR
jgi:hypothetical protein